MWRHAESGFPGEDQGCPTCSFLADSIGDLSHLHACDTTLVLVSRAPIATIERFRERMGWAVPWYSSYGSDFNYDFHVSFDEDKILQNLSAIVDAVVRARPTGAKGTYLRTFNVATTMGPAVSLDQAAMLALASSET